MIETEKLADWHYDKFKMPENSELEHIGNINLSDSLTSTIYKMLDDPYGIGGMKRIHIGDPALHVNNNNISERVRHMKKVGYTENDYFIEFNDSLPQLALQLKDLYKISYDHYCSIMINPGQCMPAHGDTYSFLMKQMKKHHPHVKYNLKENVKRYLVFLTDWEWGQSFGAGNKISYQWKAGDIFIWKPQLLHWCSNASFSPILFFEITGIQI